MTAQTPTTLKTYFTTNAKPTQTQFGNLIDSYINISQTSAQTIISGVSALGTFDIPNQGATIGSPTGGNKGPGTLNVSGNLYVNGTAVGTPSGSGTVNAGTAGQLGYYSTSTNTISGNANANISSGALTLGQAASVLGSLKLSGSTSGTTTLIPNVTASGTLTLPAATDTLTGKATTDVFTNKTYDTAGSGNVFKISGTGITSISGNSAIVATTSGSFTAGHLLTVDASNNIVDGGSPSQLMTPLAVGSIIMATQSTGNPIAAGGTTAATNLTAYRPDTGGTWATTGDSLSGTWKALTSVGSSSNSITLWQRTV